MSWLTFSYINCQEVRNFCTADGSLHTGPRSNTAFRSKSMNAIVVRNVPCMSTWSLEVLSHVPFVWPKNEHPLGCVQMQTRLNKEFMFCIAAAAPKVRWPRGLLSQPLSGNAADLGDGAPSVVGFRQPATSHSSARREAARVGPDPAASEKSARRAAFATPLHEDLQGVQQAAGPPRFQIRKVRPKRDQHVRLCSISIRRGRRCHH